MDELVRQLLEKAGEVGALLNVIEDDDEREAAQIAYERELNDVLYVGSQTRESDSRRVPR